MPATAALSPEVESTLDELLNLPAEQRRVIGERLSESLGADKERAQVAAQRPEELKSGGVVGVSIDEAFDQARRAVYSMRRRQAKSEAQATRENCRRPSFLALASGRNDSSEAAS